MHVHARACVQCPCVYAFACVGVRACGRVRACVLVCLRAGGCVDACVAVCVWCVRVRLCTRVPVVIPAILLFSTPMSHWACSSLFWLFIYAATWWWSTGLCFRSPLPSYSTVSFLLTGIRLESVSHLHDSARISMQFVARFPSK